MPDRDCAAVDVHDRRVQVAPLRQTGKGLRGERLVQLDHGKVPPADPGPPERDLGRLDGARTEELRIDRGDAPGDQPRHRYAAGKLGSNGGREEIRRPSAFASPTALTTSFS